MKPQRIFLVIGASGVGKTTITQKLHYSLYDYCALDMDAEIVKRYGEPNQEVTDYFQSVGIEAFQEKAIEILKDIKKNGYPKWNQSESLLVDMGAGSIYGSNWIFFTNEFHTILLTAYPEYLWNTRDKPNKIHKNFNQFITWQFNIPKMLHDICDIVVDVSYLSIKEVSNCLDKKISNFIKSN